jgi:hypothetical protein
MGANDRIVRDPGEHEGNPASLEIWSSLKKGKTFEEILAHFPSLTREDVLDIIARENGVEERKHDLVKYGGITSFCWGFSAFLIYAAILGVGLSSIDETGVTSWFLGVVCFLVGILMFHIFRKELRKMPERKPLPVFLPKTCSYCKKEYIDWPGFGNRDREYAKYCKECRIIVWKSSIKTIAYISVFPFCGGILVCIPLLFSPDWALPLLISSVPFFGMGIMCLFFIGYEIRHKPST